MRLFRSPMRTFAVVRKELRELWRRPGAVLSLILGPVLVMALFGLGFTGERRPLDAVVVVPEGVDLPRDRETYDRVAGQNVRVIEVTADAESARQRLLRQEIALVVIVPADAQQRLEAGEQAELRLETNELDPVTHGLTLVVGEQIIREINAEVIATAARAGYARLTAAGGQAPNVPPEVVAHPFKGLVVNHAPAEPTMVIFFAPAVLALVLQQLGMTLTALSLVRERLSGAIDLFRVSPIGTLELLVGKYLAYALLSLIVATVLVLVTTRGLGVPFFGAPGELAVSVALLTFASLGLGLLISLVSDSERQAVQLSMLVLLASVFFGGFVLAVHEFRMPFQAVSWALPATYGIAVFQEQMLRGVLRESWMLGALAGIGGVLFLLSALRLHFVLRAAR